MKPWIRRTLFGVFGGAIALGALSACSHGGWRGEQHGWGASSPEERAERRAKMVDRMARRLDLDAAQKARLQVVADKLAAQREAMMKQGDPRAQVAALVAGDKFDRAKAQAFVAEKTAAVNAASPELVAALGDFYDSLKPEQQAKVRAALQRGRGWWRRS